MAGPQFNKVRAAALREVADDHIGKAWQRELKRRAGTWVKQFGTATTAFAAFIGAVHLAWSYLGPWFVHSAGGGTP